MVQVKFLFSFKILVTQAIAPLSSRASTTIGFLRRPFGIMPLQHMEAEGLKIAMGTDIAGGHGIGIYRQVARAVQLSKLKEFYEPQESKTITITQAFYHATKESGSVFGKVGSFEKGYAFNALVIDNMEDPWTKMTAEEKLERFCYIGDDRNIKARYIDGELLEQEF